MRRAAAAAACLALFTTACPAIIFTCEKDDFDDPEALQAVQTEPGVSGMRQEIDALRAGLIMLKERDIEALFGKPTGKPEETYAMPIAQSRWFALSGFGPADPELNRRHVEFYTFDHCGLAVYYSFDGKAPEHMLLYFRVDDACPKLTVGNLNERLAWDRARLDAFRAAYHRRRAEVFVWEVDEAREAPFYEGAYKLDIEEKLGFWIREGAELGYGLRHEKSPEGRIQRWLWFRADGTLARRAGIHDEGDVLPRTFEWYDDTGRHVLRTEYTGGGSRRITCWWWTRPGSTHRFRNEFSYQGGWRPDFWSWGGMGQDPFHRQEWDDNEDGIPEWFSLAGEDCAEHPLPIEASWAVHPELIPDAYRIPDRPERLVPVRRIAP